ncbi:hypothetical protein BJX61DRAFT_332577 [Aspergillus egyptiacus]|nr:hypothetical protein BJX61DRAFT_332577 [Aspergillus egyptiacus]
MSERRWSTRLKAKLLRRSSTSSKSHPFIISTANASSSTHDLRSQHSQTQTHLSLDGNKAAEEHAADPNFASTTTTTTAPPISTTPNVLASHPPPPLTSESRPSISSLADSQYTPDELASATGSTGGQYFFVPEYQRPVSRSSAQRSTEEPPVNRSSSPTSTITQGQGQQLSGPHRRLEPNHDREYTRSASSRKSFPLELATFPLPPSRKVDRASSVAPSSPKADRSYAPPTFDSQERRTSAETAPLPAVAGKAVPITYQSFPGPSTSLPKRPSLGARRQSLLPASHQHLVTNFLKTGSFSEPEGRNHSMGSGMRLRKIWVKRPGGSATLLPTSEDALVDELRDLVVMKYANSLGKTFDAPDIIIRIATRESTRQSTPERILSPEEPLCEVVDSYYPGGQTVDEALIIEIPPRRTPRPSPRHSAYYPEPGEHGDYFPPMPAHPTPPTHQPNSATSSHPAPSISILTSGMPPTLPSPGGRSRHRRPPIARHATNSPTLLGQATDPGSAQSVAPSQSTPPIPTPPVPAPESPQVKAHTPPARVASPRPQPTKTKKPRAPLLNGAFGGLIEGTVPPINVLIVEDNVINQRLLEAFMKRLSVRWKCAANGEEAVKKWREGGFHLVLMDIQLPVMNGLDATKEIRRLERLNGIGVFPGRASDFTNGTNTNANPDPLTEEDTLHDPSLFKSPVIIVALTASSLQSDRHEALAAGCNDFLTKPVRFEWLEQKVTEWGCMQALIDFEGWRKWRGYADNTDTNGRASPAPVVHDASAAQKTIPARPPSPASPTAAKAAAKARHLKRNDLVDDSPDSGDGSDSPASLGGAEAPLSQETL